METGKFRLAIIAALVLFFGTSLAFSMAHESATLAEEDEATSIEAAAEDVAIAEEAEEETASIEAEAIAEEAEEAAVSIEAEVIEKSCSALPYSAAKACYLNQWNDSKEQQLSRTERLKLGVVGQQFVRLWSPCRPAA